MIMIFPIANADGKIEKDTGEIYDYLLSKSIPSVDDQIIIEARYNESVLHDSLKSQESEISEEEIGETIEEIVETQSGRVSWYGSKFHGKKTASGKKYDKEELTCAHKTLPFGTKVKVVNVRNGKSVIVEVNDRGPYAKGREFDLSEAAFKEIGSTNSGILNIEYQVLN